MSKANWGMRRLTIKLSLSWAAFILLYLLGWGEGESSLHATLASSLLLMCALVIAGYVFGAATDNHVNGEGGSAVGEDTQLGKWETRRGIILIALACCAGGITYLTFYGEDTTLANDFASSLCLFYTGVLNSWIFGGVYDDYALRNFPRR
ncbi:hypothetical protein [Vibrio phage vB_VmeM-Yong XC32]|nr:hypothetical protein [Vibrio phage vB_VmeM-Yong XC31]QAX96595.1 hypothetical protein [Vibrio phage vB_VmeM-Yong XC32]QAX96913.1 hypothetical protein [Vibrio phage vB_VmeM-Yong MS31]QAX97218.1 hypothetical protein [Vibrio phage vB_VmeM-Yong MS32]